MMHKRDESNAPFRRCALRSICDSFRYLVIFYSLLGERTRPGAAADPSRRARARVLLGKARLFGWTQKSCGPRGLPLSSRVAWVWCTDYEHD